MLGLLMVRDEAKILRRCVDSLRQCCDEILVVDTGSRDDTVELAEALGCRVVRHKWKDFGANRSMSFLEASSSEELAHLTWALAIDADMILQCDAPRLILTVRISGCWVHFNPGKLGTRVPQCQAQAALGAVAVQGRDAYRKTLEERYKKNIARFND